MTQENNEIVFYNVKNKSWKKICFDSDDDIINMDLKKTNGSQSRKANPKNAFSLPRANTKSPASILNNSLVSFQKKRNSLKQINDEFSFQKVSKDYGLNHDEIVKSHTFHEIKGKISPTTKNERKKLSPEKSKTFLNKSLSFYTKKLSPFLLNEKINENKKKNLLQQFEINDQNLINEFLVITPTTEIMKNTISIFNPPSQTANKIASNNKKNREKVLAVSLFKNQEITTRKKNVPCPRDGHCALIINEKMIIIGGDRHQRQYHDFFEFDLKSLFK